MTTINATRELLEQFLAGGRQCDRDRLRALLDAPVIGADDERWWGDTPDGDGALLTRVGGLTEWQRGRDAMRSERDAWLDKYQQMRRLVEIVCHGFAQEQGHAINKLREMITAQEVDQDAKTTSAILDSHNGSDTSVGRTDSAIVSVAAPQKYDDTLLPFLALMRNELHANSHKGDREGWLRMTLEQALDEIRHHADKLIVPVMNHDREAIREHAADVANCAMMLADIAGVLSRE